MTQRVLAVEDSPTQGEALRSLLASAGYDVVLATSGEEAIDIIASDAESFDLVVSDVVMPGSIDGYELCRQIKASSKRHLPVVLLTSLADPMDIINGLECGADNFITKPYDGEHLLERLSGLLETKHVRRESKLRMGVQVFFMGRQFTISSDREQILDLLMQLQADHGMGLIMITHNMGVVAETADRVVVQYKGRKMEEAGVLELFEAPKSPYTRALLSALPEKAVGNRLPVIEEFSMEELEAMR